MNILLKEVNRNNWYDCVKLKVAELQKNYVASNSFSLAESKYEPGCKPLCIYDNNTMIGFVMFAIDEDMTCKSSRETLWICRFMIDEKFQGKGYGKASLKKILDFARNNFTFDEIYISEVPENKVGKSLYKSFGFEYTGDVVEGEEVMLLKLK